MKQFYAQTIKCKSRDIFKYARTQKTNLPCIYTGEDSLTESVNQEEDRRRSTSTKRMTMKERVQGVSSA